MRLLKKWKVALALFCLVPTVVSAQNFNYTVERTTSSYVPLGPSSKRITDIWTDNSYVLPIEFDFSFAGSSFSSVSVNTNGKLTFGADEKYNFAGLLKNFYCEVNAAGESTSPILYATDTAGSRIMKIEFRNAAVVLTNGAQVYVDFQIWMHDADDAIELKVGPVSGDAASEKCTVGLLNTLNNGLAVGYLLSGDASTPIGNLINAGGSQVELNNFPASNSMYRFTRTN